MATGFCPALLRHIDEVAGENAPSRKLHVAGFTKMALCCQNSTANVINDGQEQGQTRPLTVAYQVRPLVSAVQTDESCENDATPGKLEWTLPGWTHRQYSFHIPDSTMRQYCIDALNPRRIGGTTALNEVYENILAAANAVMGSMNRALVTSAATEFGVNAQTGAYGGSTININENGASLILTNGVTQLLTELEINQICGTPCIVGNGVWHNFMNARGYGQLGLNAGGLNQAAGALPTFFYDRDTTSIWGANAIGVYAPGSVKLLTYDQFVGPAYAGLKGGSYFTNFTLPTEEFGCTDDCLGALSFDLQLRYLDCATDGMARGWQAIVSKKFALWVQPDNAYASGDPLFGTNGTLKYWIDNSTYTGDSYARYA